MEILNSNVLKDRFYFLQIKYLQRKFQATQKAEMSLDLSFNQIIKQINGMSKMKQTNKIICIECISDKSIEMTSLTFLDKRN